MYKVKPAGLNIVRDKPSFALLAQVIRKHKGLFGDYERVYKSV